MKDPIERQDAIEVVKRQRKMAWENYHETRPSAERIIEDLKELPSARPERKKGTYTVSGENAEWYYWYATCNECGKEWMGSRNFCPNCGADMRGEQDAIN